MICIEAESLGGLDFFPLSSPPETIYCLIFPCHTAVLACCKTRRAHLFTFFWLFKIREFDETLDRSLEKSRSATVMMLISLGMSLGMIQE